MSTLPEIWKGEMKISLLSSSNDRRANICSAQQWERHESGLRERRHISYVLAMMCLHFFYTRRVLRAECSKLNSKERQKNKNIIPCKSLNPLIIESSKTRCCWKSSFISNEQHIQTQHFQLDVDVRNWFFFSWFSFSTLHWLCLNKDFNINFPPIRAEREMFPNVWFQTDRLVIHTEELDGFR